VTRFEEACQVARNYMLLDKGCKFRTKGKALSEAHIEGYVSFNRATGNNDH